MGEEKRMSLKHQLMCPRCKELSKLLPVLWLLFCVSSLVPNDMQCYAENAECQV
jgi:hypothetical protein